MNYDQTATENSLTNVATNMTAIVAYTDAVQAIPLGPQPLVLNGQTVATWDPLSNMPDLESALGTAQNHCAAFNNNALLILRVFPILFSDATGSVGDSGILNDLASVSTVLSAVTQPGVTPTAAQRQTVNSALSDIQQQISGLTQSLQTASGATTTFVDQMSGDIQTCAQGSDSISQAITQVQQNFENDVGQYMGFGGQAIISILQQITGQMITYLQAIQNSLNAATAAGQPAVQALGNLQDVFTTLNSDYASTTQAVTQASDAQFGSVLQQLDVQDAQSYWQDTTSFVSAHQLVPSS